MATYGLSLNDVLQMPTKTAFELYRQTATIAYREHIHTARWMQLYAGAKSGKAYPIDLFLEPFAQRPVDNPFASSVARDLLDALDMQRVAQACLEIIGPAEVNRLYTEAMRERAQRAEALQQMAQGLGLEGVTDG